MRNFNVTALAWLVAVLLLLLAGCAAQTNLPVGLDLYKQGQESPTAELTQADIANKPAIVPSDRDGFGKVILFDQRTGEGVEWYYKLSDLPQVQPQDPQGTPIPEQEGQQTQGTKPGEIAAVFKWANDYLFGLWQLWVGIALSILFSVYVYKWVQNKKTPLPMRLDMDDIPTAISAYTYDLQLQASAIVSSEPDRANAFNQLQGKSYEEKLESARLLLLTYLEGEITALSMQVAPENASREVGRWVNRINLALKNVNWRNTRGTSLENFPITGLELRNIRLVGFKPGTELNNYITTPNEADRHAQAIRRLQQQTGLTIRDVVEMYLELNKADATRDAAKAIGSPIGEAIKLVMGGKP